MAIFENRRRKNRKSFGKFDLGWFVALLILNTLAILEIIYIFAIARRKSGIDGAAPAADDSPRRKII